MNHWDLSYTQNRELSWLKFNERVLAEAADTRESRCSLAAPPCSVMMGLSLQARGDDPLRQVSLHGDKDDKDDKDDALCR